MTSQRGVGLGITRPAGGRDRGVQGQGAFCGHRSSSPIRRGRGAAVGLFIVTLPIVCSRPVLAEIEPSPTAAARSIAADAVACLEIQHPDRLIDPHRRPAVSGLPELVPPYQKLIERPQVR